MIAWYKRAGLIGFFFLGFGIAGLTLPDRAFEGIFGHPEGFLVLGVALLVGFVIAGILDKRRIE